MDLMVAMELQWTDVTESILQVESIDLIKRWMLGVRVEALRIYLLVNKLGDNKTRVYSTM